MVCSESFSILFLYTNCIWSSKIRFIWKNILLYLEYSLSDGILPAYLIPWQSSRIEQWMDKILISIFPQDKMDQNVAGKGVVYNYGQFWEY